MKKNKKEKKSKKPFVRPETDPMGSYTGVVTDESGNPMWEDPVQDADDL